jgi:hypothetical protein
MMDNVQTCYSHICTISNDVYISNATLVCSVTKAKTLDFLQLFVSGECTLFNLVC